MLANRSTLRFACAQCPDVESVRVVDRPPTVRRRHQDAPTLAKIFSGAITRWNDPAITALNRTMPAEDIHVIYRSDLSGTTDNFQQYLQAASGGAWTKGAGKAFNGGVGTSALGRSCDRFCPGIV